MYLFSVHLYLSYRQLTNNTECVLILQWISVVVGGYYRTNTQNWSKKFMKMLWIGYEKGTPLEKLTPCYLIFKFWNYQRGYRKAMSFVKHTVE